MITPKKVFEAYLKECDIIEYLTNLKLEGNYTFDDAMTDLENEDIEKNEDTTTIGYEYSKSCSEVRNRFSDAWDTIYELLDELLCEKTLLELLHSGHWNIPSRTFKWKELEEHRVLAFCIIKYAVNNTLELNHLELAKKDKKMFKTLFLSQNG